MLEAFKGQFSFFRTFFLYLHSYQIIHVTLWCVLSIWKETFALTDQLQFLCPEKQDESWPGECGGGGCVVYK